MSDKEDFRDWAANAVDNLRQRREAAQARAQTFVAVEDLKKRRTLVLWTELKDALRSMCDAFNERAEDPLLRFESADPNRVTVNGGSLSGLTASLDSEGLSISLRAPARSESYAPKLVGDRIALAGGDNTERRPDEIAALFLDALIRRL
jgi:hypothetical protein